MSKNLQKMSKNPSFSGRIRGQKICPFESYRGGIGGGGVDGVVVMVIVVIVVAKTKK